MRNKKFILKKVIEFTIGNAQYQINVTEDSNLFNDVYYDSLAYISLLSDIEEYFSVSFTNDDINQKISTPLMFTEIIMEKLNSE